jgi:hypothetical protein
MTTTTTPRPASGAGSLPRRAALALALAVVGNVALSQLLRAAVDADRDFLPLQPGSVAVSSAVGVALGLALLLVLRRVDRQRLFRPLVAAGALLSLGGPLSLLGATQAEQPGVSDDAALVLVPLHLLVAAVVAVVLPRDAR